MEKLDEELNIYSEEVRDVLSHPPKAIFKWGNTILFGFVIILMALSWFIKYPDIVQTEIVITTQIPPEKLIAKTSGRIDKILIKDRQKVSEKTPLAIIENPANYKDVFFLKTIVDTIKVNNSDFEFPLDKIPVLSLGTIESAYAVFEKDYLAYRINKDYEPYNIDKSAQSFETVQQNERLKLLIEQKEIGQKELQYKKTELERNKRLFDKGVISAQEWDSKNMEYLQQEKNINSLTSQISQLRSSLNDLNRNKKSTNLSETKDDLNLFRSVILSFNQLKKAITDWEMAYVLQSSSNGEVSFLQIWTENQTINTGDNVFVIIPTETKSYLGKIKAPALNSGKIKIGQNVNIRLSNYPDREFGMLNGVIKTISLTPDKDNNLLIDVELPKGLETSYKKDIVFQQEMSGTADIITEDLRLIERLLYQFRDMFRRS